MMSVVRRALGHASADAPWLSRKVIREELFSAERLEQHARSLAVAQTVTSKSASGHPLSGRLADNGAVLLRAYRTISRSIDEGRAITPAAEWLVDNYYLVESELREIRAALPPGYYRQLPKVRDGPFAGYPRVFGVAWAFVAHTDSHFDLELLCRFVRTYQEVQPLTIGELWAVAITLRIVLVENLRRLADLIVHSGIARQEANVLADRLLGASGRAAEPVPVVLAGREGTALSEAFVVQLVHRLRDQDPSITPALTWLDQQLAMQRTTADAIVHEEHQRQGSAVVTVRNIITGMRMISDVDWTDMFERVNLVDEVLADGSVFVTWIFRLGICIAMLSRNCREARTARNSMWLGPPCRRQHKQRMCGETPRKTAAAMPAITFSLADGAHSKQLSASALRRVRGPGV